MKKTNGPGIDYGRGMSNVDLETGIRYGVIHQNEVLQAWADSAEADYYVYGDEALGFSLDDEEYEASQSGDDCDIFILKSPYYTRCQFCSPCAPGAGYLMNECEDGPKAYCFGHDWFDEGKAPYKVFRADNNEEVPPPDVN